MSAIRNLRRKPVTAVEPSLERVAEPGQQVIERERACSASPAMHLVDGAVDKASQSSSDRCGPGIVGARDDMDAWVSEHLDAEFREILQFRELVRDRWVTNRLRGEHVGTHRFDEIVGVVEKRRVGVAGSCRAQSGEHLRGEAVDGRDRGRVKVGDSLFEAIESALAIAGGQESKELVGGRDVRGPAQRGRGLAEPAPNAVAQLGRGGTGERDDEELFDADRLFRHVSHDEAGECVGLAGSCARFDGDTAAGQRVQEREDRWCAHICSATVASIVPHR